MKFVSMVFYALIAVTSVSAYTVVIDAGHGGRDPGAIGANGIEEKAVCLQFSQDLKAALEQFEGVVVKMTRDGDHRYTLAQRSEKIAQINPDLVISIHMDKSPVRRLAGMSLYTQSVHSAKNANKHRLQRQFLRDHIPKSLSSPLQDKMQAMLMDAALYNSEKLAAHIVNELKLVLPFRSKKVIHRELYLLHQAVPNLLIEIGFISNLKDVRRMQNKVVRENIAQGLAKSIVDFGHEMGMLVGAGRK